MTVAELIENMDDEHIILIQSNDSSDTIKQNVKQMKESILYSKLEVKKIKNITEIII